MNALSQNQEKGGITGIKKKNFPLLLLFTFSAENHKVKINEPED